MKEKPINFVKYSALGNDYIVIDPNKNSFDPDKTVIKNICNRNFGIGADGILLGPIIDWKNKTISVRIFNSDGSEAEKSGNGLRIFSQYLMDEGYIQKKTFGIDGKRSSSIIIKTIGGNVRSTYNDDGTISIQMGKIEFYNEEIEVEAFNEDNLEEKTKFKGTYLSIGNPHFVIILDRVDEKIAKKYGKSIENNSIFPNKTNVQFAQVLNEKNIKIEIFERGSGYTLASGSSACAAAATTFKKGLIKNEVEVLMQGGSLKVLIDDDFNVLQIGKVKKIFYGNFFISTFLDKFQN